MMTMRHIQAGRGEGNLFEPSFQLVACMSIAELKHVHGGHMHVAVSLILVCSLLGV